MPVAQKNPNIYGLYDMSGNGHYTCGGSWYDYSGSCEVGNGRWNIAYGRGDGRGFRIVRSTGK